LVVGQTSQSQKRDLNSEKIKNKKESSNAEALTTRGNRRKRTWVCEDTEPETERGGVN